MRKQSKSGGARKIGRNKIKCQRYRNENRRIKNKISKITKHLKKFANDLQSIKYLAKIQ